ncbi:hypothetical protein SDJN02_21646, partial [Cucurbita argyrosperma subsp. argyrosperma]
MGAEEAAMEQEKLASRNPRTIPITETQFLSWKRQKIMERNEGTGGLGSDSIQERRNFIENIPEGSRVHL